LYILVKQNELQKKMSEPSKNDAETKRYTITISKDLADSEQITYFQTDHWNGMIYNAIELFDLGSEKLSSKKQQDIDEEINKRDTLLRKQQNAHKKEVRKLKQEISIEQQRYAELEKSTEVLIEEADKKYRLEYQEERQRINAEFNQQINQQRAKETSLRLEYENKLQEKKNELEMTTGKKLADMREEIEHLAKIRIEQIQEDSNRFLKIKVEQVEDGYLSRIKSSIENIEQLKKEIRLLQEQNSVKESQYLSLAEKKNDEIKQLIIELKHERESREQLLESKNREIVSLTEEIKKDYDHRLEMQEKTQANMHKQMADLMTREKQLLETSFNKQIEILESKSAAEKATLTQIITSHQETQQSLKQQLRATALLYEEQINLSTKSSESKKQTTDMLTEIKQFISTELKPVNKFLGGTNHEKGILGENFIHDVLLSNKRFVGAEIIEVSHQSDEGDLHFNWDNLKCLIEIKNKKTITPADITKFKSNVSTSAVNSGLFISLQTSKFGPSIRDSISYDSIDDKPIIFIYFDSTNTASLENPLLSLNHILSISNKKTITDTQAQLDLCRDRFVKQQANLSSRRAKLAAEIKIIDKELADINKLLVTLAAADVSASSNKPPTTRTKPTKGPAKFRAGPERSGDNVIVDDDKSTDDKSTDNKSNDINSSSLEKTLIDGFNNGFIPDLSDLDIDPSLDLNSIITSAKNKFVYSILTPAKTKLLIEYYQTNKHHMTRSDIERNKIITQGEFRKLAAIINRPHDYICRLIDESIDSSASEKKSITVVKRNLKN
jgi:hypothetical protein